MIRDESFPREVPLQNLIYEKRNTGRKLIWKHGALRVMMRSTFAARIPRSRFWRKFLNQEKVWTKLDHQFPQCSIPAIAGSRCPEFFHSATPLIVAGGKDLGQRLGPHQAISILDHGLFRSNRANSCSCVMLAEISRTLVITVQRFANHNRRFKMLKADRVC